MQLRWRNWKMRLKCIKKYKNFTKNLFLFSSKEGDNVIADCSTRLYCTSFQECSYQISKIQIAVIRIHYLPHVLLTKQSGNHASLRKHRRRWAANTTNKLEFNDLNESVIRPVCVLSWDLDCIVCDCDHWINALTQPLLF